MFSITDQGIGMSQEEQSKLEYLLKYGYCDKVISESSSGYGFGLSLSNKLIHKMNKEEK